MTTDSAIPANERRRATVEEFETITFDVCVIGGGATGAGCALDARTRGLRTALIESGDFASGTSGTSTKLVHGGVRYLERAFADRDLGQYRVVQRALSERATMLANAPHLAHPLEHVIPCYRWFDVIYYAIGLRAYDAIAGRRNLLGSRPIGGAEIARKLPGLARRGIRAAISYADGQFDDARFNVALGLSAAEAGAAVLTQARALAFETNDAGRVTSVVVEDRRSNRRFAVRAHAFVNATGPFADRLRLAANPAAEARLRVSKGVHIVLPLDVLSPDTALLIPKTDDGRVIFAIPYLGRLIVGTTDDEASLEEPMVVTRAEVEYLLHHLNRYLETAVTPGDVLGGFAGLRPLVRSVESRDSKRLIRDHEVEVDVTSGLVSVLGGKWTTYRAMAQDGIDEVVRRLGLGNVRSRTANYPLRGAEGYDDGQFVDLVRRYGISATLARYLSRAYGVHAARVLDAAHDDADAMQPIVAGAPAIVAQIAYSVREEMALELDDIIARRIGLERFGWAIAWEAAPIVADGLRRELGWSAAHAMEEVARYRGDLHARFEAIGVAPPSAAGARDAGAHGRFITKG